MAKGPRLKRQPNFDDLSVSQRKFYKDLPENLKEGYLAQLAPIAVSSVGRSRKSGLIRKRIEMLDHVIRSLQAHRRELTQLANNLDAGTVSATKIDLRHRLSPPSIRGISMRYVRKPGES